MDRRDEILYKILDYPVVQYITIKPWEILYKENWLGPVPTGEPRLYISNNWQEISTRLENYQIKHNLDSTEPSTGNMYLITHNMRVLDIKYRTYSVVLIGKSEENSLHVYRITTRDFYRDSLNFMLYDEFGNLVQSKVVNLE